MKKICLFSTKAIKGIEGEEAELYVNFYLVLNRNYIFTFLINAPNLSCSDRHPIKLWKHFLIMLEEENVKYMRRCENMRVPSITGKWRPVYQGDEIINYRCSECEFGNTFGKSTYRMNFCPNCGAKMESED